MNPIHIAGPQRAAFILAVVVLGGCASTAMPVVYQPPPQNIGAAAERQHLTSRAEKVQKDMAECRQAATEAVGVQRVASARTGEQIGKRGAVEFVDKAVESLVAGARNSYERARGAAAGVMAGSVAAMVLNWNEPDSVHRNYVDICLRERGHRVLGWR